MKKRSYVSILIATCMVAGMLSGCSFGGSSDESASSDTAEATVQVEENEHLAVNTVIAYSAGSDSDWSYGNQRKEFPDKEKCYVRIASVLTTDKGKYENDAVVVTYRFTGTDKCVVNISDGLVEEVDTGNSNVKEFTHTIYANTEKNASEDVVIFQYIPQDADGMTLEVIYDDQVATRYDARNAIYFTSNGDNTVQEVTEEPAATEDVTPTEDDNSDAKRENGTN